MFCDFTEAESFENACLGVAITLQHFVGGSLCLPSVLGVEMRGASAALACHGALCEAGWELQDFVARAHQILRQGQAGRRKNPVPLLVILTLHHVAGQSLCIPMNIHYRTNRDYHEMVFLLQFAAFVALALQCYGFTLDVESRTGLRKMRGAVIILWLTVAYSRIVRYAVVGYRLLAAYRTDGHDAMLWAGCFAMATMSIINVLFFFDATCKLKKFMTMRAVQEAQEDVCRAPPAGMAEHKFITADRVSCTTTQGAVLLGTAVRAGKRACFSSS